MLTRPIPKLLAPLAACVALVALAPAGAVAATASLEGGTFTYSAGAGELNNVRVTVDGAPGEGDTVVEIENVNGGAGADTLIGAAGANALAGGGGDDTLRGGDGGDTLSGGTGTDAFDGGAGADVVNSRDAVAEQVACGADADTANPDTLDSVAADCEQLTRAAPTGGGVVSPPKLDVSLRRLGNTDIALDAKPHVAVERKRVVAVDITCVAATGRCVGELTLLAMIPRSARTSDAVAARRSRPTTVGKERFDLARGEKRRLRVRISRRSRPRLVDNRVDVGKVEIRQRSGGKRRYAAARVKIRPTA